MLNFNSCMTKTSLKELPIEQLTKGQYQPRQTFDTKALQELADTIKNVGVLEPLIVRLKNKTQTNPIIKTAIENLYEIIAGERRWRAAQLAGLEKVPCLIGEFTDEQAIQIALIENLSRQDLNPIEEAEAIARLIEEFEFTHEEVAKRLGKPRTEVTNLLRLLKLDTRVRTLLISQDLSESHGKILAGIPIEQQYHYAKEVVVKNWSIRALEKALKQTSKPNYRLLKNTISENDPNVKRLERNLSDYLGTNIHLEVNVKQQGKLQITFNNLEEFEGILQKIGFSDGSD